MRVYVTGGTGFVGSNIVKLAAECYGHDVTATARTPAELHQPGTFASVDLLDREAVRASVTRASPDVVIHAAILNDFNRLYAEPRLGWDSYVEATRSVIDAANEVGAVVVYVSTDWVFDGMRANSGEDTPPNPVNYYGFLKAAGELVTLERANDAIVARIAGVNGWHWAQKQGPRSQDAGFGFFVASLVDAVTAGEPFTVWESEKINVRATPSLASESARMMFGLVEAGARGTFHCCGGESVSRMELAQAAAEVFELDSALIGCGPPEDAAMLSAPVPYDTSLSATHTSETFGYRLPSVRELLVELRRQRATGEVRPVGPSA